MSSLRVGAVLGRSLGIWFKNFIPFTLISLIAFSPLILYLIVFLTQPLTLESVQTFQRIMPIGAILLGMIAAGGMTYGVIMQLRGQPASIGTSLRVGVSRMLPVLGVGLLSALFVALGVLALVVGAFVVLCGVWVAVPVAVVEKPGVMASIKRSWELSKGSRWSIFAILLIVGLVEAGLDQILQEGMLKSAKTVGEVKTYIAIILIIALIKMMYQSVTNAVTYHDLRTAKEGASVEELAAVFD